MVTIMEKKFIITIDQDEESLGIDTATIRRAVEVWLDGDTAYHYKIMIVEENTN